MKVLQHDSTCFATDMQAQKSWSFKLLPLTFWLTMWDTKFEEILKHQISKQSKAFNVLKTWTWYLLLTLMVGILTFLELLWLTLWGKKAKSSGLKWIWHYPNFHPLLVYWWRLPIVKVQDSAATQSARHLYIKHWKSLHTIYCAT